MIQALAPDTPNQPRSLTPNARGEPRPKAEARNERKL